MSTVDAPERTVAPVLGAPPRVLIIQAPYYTDVVGGMHRGATLALRQAGIEKIETVDVAGAFELPAALRMAIDVKTATPFRGWDGFVLLGCVIKGETDHYDFLCQGTFAGVAQISAETGAPIGFGLLTVANLEQAQARAADDRFNKGAESAHAMLQQLRLRRGWQLP